MHARQALVLGLIGSAGLLLVLALPLSVIVASPALSNAATIGIYAIGLSVDVLAAAGLILVSVRYARRAARGELFAIAVVTPIVDRWFRRKRR